MAGWLSTACNRSTNFPSAQGRIASRSKGPAIDGILSAETQKWFDQNQTSRSAKPMSAVAAASKRALASFCSSCCGSGGSLLSIGFGDGGAGGATQGCVGFEQSSKLALVGLLASASFLAR